MKRLSLLLYIVVLAAAPALAQKVDRTKAPQPKPAPVINIGKYQSFTLKNGLKCFLVENHQLPRVSYQITLDNDPVMEGEAAGYISMAGDLMKKGTSTRTKDQINEEIDFIGASLSASSNGIYGSSLNKHQSTMLEIMSDVLMNPIFPEEELEKLKKDMLSNLSANKSDPDAISDNVADVLRFGKKHPYGELITESTVKNIDIEKVKSYYKTYFKPANAYLIIVGDINLKDAKKTAKKYFATWAGENVPSHTYNKPTAPEKTQVALVDKPGAVQSVVTITYPIEFELGSDDYVVARLMNTVLGSSGSGRLFKNIREDKGWTYGAYSQLAADKDIGYFSDSAKVRNDVTDSAIVEFMSELKRIRDEKVSVEELELMKSKMSGRFALSLERPQTVAAFALNTAMYKLPADYYQNYLQKIAAVTPEDIQKAAQKYIKPENAYIQVVGAASELKDKLSAFGTVKQYDIYGEEVKEMKVSADVTAEQVIENYIKARGGRAALENVKDIYTEMEASTPMGALTFIVSEKAPDKKAVVQQVNGQTMGKQVFTAKKVAIGGQTFTEGPQFDTFKSAGLMHPELNYAKHGYTLKLNGKKMLNGKAVYEVTVGDPNGNKVTNSYDVETGFLVQTVDKIAGTQTFAKYSKVDGVMFPYEIIVPSPLGELKLQVKSVKVNKGIEDSTFE